MKTSRLRLLGLFAVLMAAIVVAGLGSKSLRLPQQEAAFAQERGQADSTSQGASFEQVSTAVLPKGLVTLRMQFGSKLAEGKKTPTTWDGQLTVSGGRLHGLRLWQPHPQDSVEGAQWKLSTRHMQPFGEAERKKGIAAMPVADAAVLVELTDCTPDAKVAFQTAQGNFDFRLQDIALGVVTRFLDNLVQVSRLPNETTILSAPSEDDFPSAALGRDGKLYVAYVAFTHGKDFRSRPAITEEPKSFDYLAEPTGGDQVLLLRLDGSKWIGPLPVTPPGQDVFRPAIAIDGSGKVCVFWTAKQRGMWNLYARSLAGEQWSQPIQLTAGPGPDIFPAATTDSAGRVWVTWQGFRGSKSKILAAQQEGNAFGQPTVVAEGPANCWNPAIAASASGQVAVAWDTYAKGDYDVYCRIWAGGQFGQPIPIATSLEAQMRPSIAYDRDGRLWIAYENSPENWGKDWGALVKKGVALYQGRSVAIRMWADGKLWQPTQEPAKAFAGIIGRQGQEGRMSQLAWPRLATDAAGRMWLSVRTPALGTRTNVGTIWYDHLAWYEGDKWSPQTVCPGTDNLLDSRPELVARPSGEMVLIAASDGRAALGPGGGGAKKKAAGKRAMRAAADLGASKPSRSPWPDAVNNELIMAELGPVRGSGPVKLELQPIALPQAGEPTEAAKAEAGNIAAARAARTTTGGKSLQIFRGEFHRHTEISGDGGGDGMLMDMWRYALDAAGLDWVGCGDHDNGNGREYSWWITQKTTDLFTLPGSFTPMFTYERSVSYPDGHRNVVFAKRGVRTLPRLQGGLGQAMDELPPDALRPHTPDTQLLYKYLAYFDGVCASHTSGTNMGTDWRDDNGKVEPIVEIYQGCRQSYEMPGAPRSNTADNSLGGWRPFGFVSLALKKGYRLGFQSSSDHVATHLSQCVCWVESPSREGILAAMKARHVYGATDNIIADVHCGDHFMGDEFTLSTKPALKVRLAGTGPLAKVHIIKDGNYVHTAEPKKQAVEFEWTDLDVKPGATSYYYVRGEQEDGELVWVSPMWITYKP
jgi:hypothetical protein